MKAAMSTRDRRALLIGALVLAPGFIFIWGVRPYRAAVADARDQLASERATLSRELGAIATAQRNPRLQHVTDSALTAMQPRLFEGKDDVIASADLAAYLGDVAHDSHVWLQDASTRPATAPATGVRALHVDIRAESDFRGMLTLIQALERGDKMIRIDRMDISRTLGGINASNTETLTLSATITGYAMGASAGAAPAGPVVAATPGSRP
ncbi:MAG TPA: type II secretion system protein GspM [Gemmatimonadaceae bacterium]